jgi:TolB-like protein
MAAPDDTSPDSSAAGGSQPTVFLSYASQDRAAAISLRDALRGLGFEVWYDESELGGGEAWDQKIRRQIRECDFFMPVVSAQTETRLEGYFRREWRLAVERTQDMADDHLFLLPVVIDDTDQTVARVPERFLSVQWIKLPGGRPGPALEALGRRIVSGEALQPPSRRKARSARRAGAAKPDYPPFPPTQPRPRLQYFLALLGWTARCALVAFRRLPRLVRIVAIIWFVAMLAERGCSSSRHEPDKISPATAEKLKAIAQQYQGSSNKSDIVKLGAQIASEIAKDSGDAPDASAPLLAIPFAAPAGRGAAGKFADSTFATVYGQLAISRHGHVALAQQPMAAAELGAALQRGQAQHATYVLYGGIEQAAAAQMLNITIASVEDHSIMWSRSYPLTGSDPAAIAAEVDSKVPSLED